MGTLNGRQFLSVSMLPPSFEARLREQCIRVTLRVCLLLPTPPPPPPKEKGRCVCVCPFSKAQSDQGQGNKGQRLWAGRSLPWMRVLLSITAKTTVREPRLSVASKALLSIETGPR